MLQLFAAAFLLACIVTGYLSSLRGFSAQERQWVVASSLAHLASVAGIIWLNVNYYKGGDMLYYFDAGTELGRIIESSPDLYLGEAIKLVFRGQPKLPMAILGPGTSTGTMVGLAGLLVFTFGSNIFAICAVVGVVGLIAKILLYRSLKEHLPKELHFRALIASLLVPSMVFWSSGLQKEAFAMLGLALVFRGTSLLLTRLSRYSGYLALSAGITLVGLVKAYILIVFAISAGVWFYWKKAGAERKIRPVRLILASVVALLAVVGVGEIFPL